MTKLTLANSKHKELIAEMVKSAKGDNKKQLHFELERINKLGESVKALRSK